MTNPDIRSIALAAATESAPHGAVGDFIESKIEDDGSQTFLFRSRLKGYVGWHWTVNLFEDAETAGVTVSEVLLMPGDEALIAPDWVPWSERLADYKALQAELAAQAAAEGEDSEESDEDSEEDEDSDEIDEDAEPEHFTEDEVEAEVEAAQELAAEADESDESDESDEDSAASTDPEPTEEAKGKTNNGRGRFQRRRLGRKSNKK
jgi:hypothetical protein